MAEFIRLGKLTLAGLILFNYHFLSCYTIFYPQLTNRISIYWVKNKEKSIQESELVSGFMTEHSAVPFVFFFLGEYSSIVLFSCISAILFLGGYNMPELFVNDSILNIQSIILGLKTCLFCFLFV